MSSLRASARLLGFLVCSGTALLLYVLGRLLVRVLPRLDAPLHNSACRFWTRSVAAVIGMRVRVIGAPPKGPFMLVSNHLGYIDIITLMTACPAVFVSRGDLKHWPLLGVMARASGTLFIDRELRRDVMRINALIRGVLERGLGLIVFAEGTSSDGSGVLPFRSSLLEPAVASSLPVHWACLHYQAPAHGPPASRAVCWWGEMTFLPHFWRLLGLKRVDATLRFGETPVAADDRRELAAALQRCVSDALRELQTQPTNERG
ncbi:MAG: 1-acyl-sn-glycerol-3-phosphate acyltransferase [Planctomycetota bacterium]|nr:MAG: 1-acyl-sn-glycerol-3-phosphate acyltransferase [Planctomycetota bacterium]